MAKTLIGASAKLLNAVGFTPENSIEKAAENISLHGEPPLVGESYHQSEPPHSRKEADVAGRARFTRIPKTTELIQAGVPAEVIPTYCALADHANNKTGLCWPKMETLALILKRSVRTVQRHLYLLCELGLIEFVERRRYRGRFSSYLYKVLFLATTGHGSTLGKRDSNKRRTKLSTNLRKETKAARKSPTKNVKEGYKWLFDEQTPPDEQQARKAAVQKQRDEEAKRRREGYEWLFR